MNLLVSGSSPRFYRELVMSIFLWMVSVWIALNLAFFAAMRFKPFGARRRRSFTNETLSFVHQRRRPF